MRRSTHAASMGCARPNRSVRQRMFIAALAAITVNSNCGGDSGVEPPDNRAPAAVGTIPAQTVQVGSTVTVDVSAYFSDPDGDALTYGAATSDGSVVVATVSASTVTLTGVAGGEATVTATATDPGGLSASQSFAVSVTPDNRAPAAVGTIPAQTMQVGSTVTVDVSAYFSDPDGDALTYGAATSDGSVVVATVSASTVTLTGVAGGEATVTATATDPGGLSASQSFAVSVTPDNRAPAAVGTIPAQTVQVGSTVTVDVSAYFSDPDGDALTYGAATSDGSVVVATVSASTVTLTGVAGGEATVTATATDPGGLSASQSFAVSVTPDNRAPRPVGTIPAQTLDVGDTIAIDASSYFEDPDGDALTYTAASSNVDVASASASGSIITVVGIAEGSTTVTVTAIDPGGLSASQAASITVVASAGVCERTEQVRDEIIRITRKANCSEVTSADLARIRVLRFSYSHRIAALKEGDFAGLSGLEQLSLLSDDLVSLPETIFAGLSRLQKLTIYGSDYLVSLPQDVFTDLTSLEELDLQYNELVTLPDGVFAGLSRLQVLDLESNELTALPESVFAGLSSLSVLDLASNDLAELPESIFAGLSSLESLNLFGNDLIVLPEDLFTNHTKLKVLILGANDFVTLPESIFAGLSSLERLYLDANDLVTLPQDIFSEVPRLERLWLNSNKLSSLPESIFAGLSSLQFLALYLNELVTLPEGVFTGLSSLQILELSSNDLVSLPEGLFAGLSSLRGLDVASNKLATLPEGLFTGLARLESLELYRNELAALPEGLFADVARLRYVYMSNNELATLPESLFADLPRLETLILSENAFAALPKAIFAGLTSLRHMDLSANPGTPFKLVLQLERTDDSLSAAPAADVRLALAEGAPFTMAVPISVEGGSSSPSVATLPAGSTEGPTFSVTQATTGQPARVSAKTLPRIPSLYYGISLIPPDTLVLFSSGSSGAGHAAAEGLNSPYPGVFPDHLKPNDNRLKPIRTRWHGRSPALAANYKALASFSPLHPSPGPPSSGLVPIIADHVAARWRPRWSGVQRGPRPATGFGVKSAPKNVPVFGMENVRFSRLPRGGRKQLATKHQDLATLRARRRA